MADRKLTHSRQLGGPAVADAARVTAYQHTFGGNGSKDDCEIVLTDLATFTGYHTRPSFAGWKGGAEEFLLESALANARAEVMQHIVTMLGYDEGQRLALEQAARAEAALLRIDAGKKT